jgi:ketosteroid isomerase-like protein
MLVEGWGAVDALFDMAPQIKTLHDGDDVLIARGFHLGSVRATGEPFRAAFAHFWGFDGKCFTSVHQITDSVAWARALN